MRIFFSIILFVISVCLLLLIKRVTYYQLHFYNDNNKEVELASGLKSIKNYVIENNIYFELEKESEYIYPLSKIRNYVISKKIGNYPWSKNLDLKSKDDYLLPMRIGLEKYQDWKTLMNNRFERILDSLDNIGTSSRRDVSLCVLKDLNSWFHFDEDIIFSRYPSVDYLLSLKKGDCYTICYISVMALRASGVPAALDFCPFWSNKKGGHSEFVYLNDNHMFESNVNTEHKNGLKNAPKVYRLFSKENAKFHFLKNRDIHTDLGFLADFCYEDVTMQHTDVNSKTIAVNSTLNGELIYACVCSDGEWHPVAVALADSSRVVFENLNTQISYRFAYLKNDTFHQIL